MCPSKKNKIDKMKYKFFVKPKFETLTVHGKSIHLVKMYGHP